MKTKDRLINFIGWTIRGVSILYIYSAGILFVPGGFGVFLFALIILVVLPSTFFGFPFEPSTLNSEGMNTELASPLLGIATVLGIAAFWSAGQILKLRLRGVIVYTVVVGSLICGMILDYINGSEGFNLIQPISYFIAFVFVLSVVVLWWRFWKLGVLQRKPVTTNQ